MKKIIIFLSVFIVSALLFSLSAQEQQYEQLQVKEKSSVSSNWFISVGPGANLLFGEQDAAVSAFDRIQLGGELSVGKWFSPNFGARLQVSGGALRGFNYMYPHGGDVPRRYFHHDRRLELFPLGYKGDLNVFDVHDPNQYGRDASNWTNFEIVNGDDGIGFWQDFNYFSTTIDLMANLTNLITGKVNNNLIDIIPYVGAGFIRSFKSDSNPNYNAFVGKFGIRGLVNINRSLGIFLEPQLNMINEDFDGYMGNRGFDMVTNLYFGVQFTINKGFKTNDYLTLDEINYLNQKINYNRGLIDNHQDILDDHENRLNRIEDECCDESTTEVIVKENFFLPEYIRFGLDSYIIERGENAKLDDAATYLNAHPDVKLLLVGYADRQTGNPTYNMNLSQQRVEAVANELRMRGINSSRLIVQWLGDTKQPYNVNDLNRVVVMVERK